jgi:hypothetical protein
MCLYSVYIWHLKGFLTYLLLDQCTNALQTLPFFRFPFISCAGSYGTQFYCIMTSGSAASCILLYQWTQWQQERFSRISPTQGRLIQSSFKKHLICKSLQTYRKLSKTKIVRELLYPYLDSSIVNILSHLLYDIVFFSFCYLLICLLSYGLVNNYLLSGL